MDMNRFKCIKLTKKKEKKKKKEYRAKGRKQVLQRLDCEERVWQQSQHGAPDYSQVL
jgi:hypothetical protein